jgi:hypothetical protein
MSSLTNGLTSIPYRARYKAFFHGSRSDLQDTLINLVKKINVLEAEFFFHSIESQRISEESFAQRDNADFSSKQSTAKSAPQVITSTSQTSSHDECHVTLRADPLLSLRIYSSRDIQDSIEVTFDVDSMVPIETSIDHLFFEPAKIFFPTIKSIYNFLGEPKVTVHKSDRHSAILENNQWLRDHRQEYSGQWVALKNGKLLASANSAKELLHQVNATEDTLLTAVY